jgi:hypothetical protein
MAAVNLASIIASLLMNAYQKVSAVKIYLVRIPPDGAAPVAKSAVGAHAAPKVKNAAMAPAFPSVQFARSTPIVVRAKCAAPGLA